MKKENSAFALYATVCSLIMLAILFLTLFTLKKAQQVKDEQKNDIISSQTEYVYIYASPSETVNEAPDTSDTYFWIVREHDGRIGIFNADNVLLHVIETHIKTLPVADRDLLREGIWVSSRKELLAIIEDYTG